MEKIAIKFNGRDYTVTKGITILAASLETQELMQEFRRVDIPTLYFLKGINDIDDSGVCVVEVDGELVNASTARVKPGMEIFTNTEKVLQSRREALSKILAIHNKDCINCTRSESCELQILLHEYGFTNESELPRDNLEELDMSSLVLVRDNNKCIRCKRCVAVCAKVQSVSAICATGEGLETVIAPASPKGLAASSCVNCGQCVVVCPVGALTEKDNTQEVYAALANPDKFVVVEVAPSVRVALGEAFEYPPGVDVEGQIAAALRRLGFDRVFDTKFSADLTIMEEAHEFLDRVQNDGALPLITSCCPGWIKYCEHFYPDMLDNLSSCKSPQQMFGAVAKACYAEKAGVAKENLVVVSVMPCTAKKFEKQREYQCGAGVPDVDIVITTSELAHMIKKAEIQLASLPFDEFDMPLGMGIGAGVIFGATGGVMEAALRTAVAKLTGEKASPLEFTEVRGMNGIKEAAYDINDTTVKVAAVSGLANANALLTKIKRGEADYHFIEIMACPGGCVNGCGQPHHIFQAAEGKVPVDIKAERTNALYRNDAKSPIRKSHENPSVIELYDQFLGQPGSKKAHQLLHTTYIKR